MSAAAPGAAGRLCPRSRRERSGSAARTSPPAQGRRGHHESSACHLLRGPGQQAVHGSRFDRQEVPESAKPTACCVRELQQLCMRAGVLPPLQRINQIVHTLAPASPSAARAASRASSASATSSAPSPLRSSSSLRAPSPPASEQSRSRRLMLHVWSAASQNGYHAHYTPNIPRSS